MTTPIGRRFGRIATATEVHTPAISGARTRGLVAAASASAHMAVAGTSLMGWTSWNRNTGLHAISTAAATPTLVSYLDPSR